MSAISKLIFNIDASFKYRKNHRALEVRGSRFEVLNNPCTQLLFALFSIDTNMSSCWMGCSLISHI